MTVASTSGLVLFAALLHASWNALLHGTQDRFLAMTWMSMPMAVIAMLFILMGAPMPTAAAWPYIIASGLIHIVYNCCLVWSYRIGDFSRAYPIARVFLRESVSRKTWLACFVVAAGAICLGL